MDFITKGEQGTADKRPFDTETVTGNAEDSRVKATLESTLEMRPLYEPLDSLVPQFRLLKLVSQEDNDHIRLSMDTFVFAPAPPYKVLSYEWGPKTFSLIEVSRNPVAIRRNLHAFLEIFRRRNDNSYIWIDQLSVNQEDVHERSAQVAMMHKIYSSADETFIWLGSKPEAVSGLSAVKELISQLPEDRDRLTSSINIDLVVSKLSDLQSFYRATYWQRLWIVQEVALSRKRTVVMSGGEPSWEELFDFNDELVSDVDESAQAFEFEPLAQLLSLIAAVKEDSAGYMESGPDAETWLQCMTVAAGTHCEDPRDKIYGIQGLLGPEWRTTVDYSKPCKDLYLEATTIYSRHIKCRDYEFFRDGCRALAYGMGLDHVAEAWSAPGPTWEKHIYEQDWFEHTPKGCTRTIRLCAYSSFEEVFNRMRVR